MHVHLVCMRMHAHKEAVNGVLDVCVFEGSDHGVLEYACS